MSIEIIAEIPSSSKEFENLINCIHSSDFFKKNGYNITLPKINIFRDLYDNPEKIKNTDMGELKKLFVKEEYSRCFFNKSSETIKETISDLKIDMLKRIFILSENWDFKLFEKYKVNLTKYGPGGSYDYNTGEILQKVSEEGLTIEEDPAHNLLHEVIHMGIQENIVEKYKLYHWEKERLVDLIFVEIFGDYFSDYKLQKQGDKAIDEYIKGRIISDLPNAVKEYVDVLKR